MHRQIVPAIAAFVVLTVLTLAYGAGTTLINEGLFPDQADGSLVENADGEVVGSALIAQSFTEEEYFHPRPSPNGYTPGPSYAYGSNYGIGNETLLYGEDDPETPDVDESETNGIDDLVRAYREENHLSDEVVVPVDAVTGSGSGLDPHISVANATLQAARVAAARGLDLDVVLDLVEAHTSGRALGFLGEEGVNVLELNVALDAVAAP